MAPAGGTGNKRLRIVTRCTTIDEFFATFGAFADESSLFIVTNKPRALGLVQPFVIQLKDGTILSGSSTEGLSPPPQWQVHIERSTDGGKTWSLIKVPTAEDGPAAIQPSFIEHADGSIQSIACAASAQNPCGSRCQRA